MLQVYVFKATRTKENYLELLTLRDELCKQADLIWLAIIRTWTHLVGFICSKGYGIPRSEVLSVNRVPVQEKVRHWALIFSKITDERSKL